MLSERKGALVFPPFLPSSRPPSLPLLVTILLLPSVTLSHSGSVSPSPFLSPSTPPSSSPATFLWLSQPRDPAEEISHLYQVDGDDQGKDDDDDENYDSE